MLILSTPGFTSPTDIANRALNHLGADHKIDDLLTDVSKNQRLVFSVYTKLRQAELRRNSWKFAIKHAIMRPLAAASMLWTPPAYDAATTYRVGQVVSYDAGYGSRYWINTKPSNLGSAPGGTDTTWENYCGPLVATAFDTTLSSAYYPGDLVYETDNAGSFTTYISLTDQNAEDPSTTDTYSATTTYNKDQIVVYNAQNYISLIDQNLGHQPDTSAAEWATTALTGSYQWVTVGGTLQQLNILWPLGSGVVDQSSNDNVYPLPYSYLRKAPQDPKAGLHTILGASTNRQQDDWIIENNYLVSRESQPIAIRFVADIDVVALMDPMFCEGLAARIAWELCEPITQAVTKQRAIAADYQKFMTEARLVNGIENEAVMPAEDDWIVCRM